MRSPTPPASPSRRARRRWLAPAALVASGALAACLPTGPGTERISTTTSGAQLEAPSGSAVITPDSRYVAFTSQADSLEPRGDAQIFRRDRSTNEVQLVSVGLDGQASLGRNVIPSISRDGTRVAWARITRDSTGLNDISVAFVRDLAANRTILVSQTAAGQETEGDTPRISADGRFVAFASSSPQIVAGDTNGARDVFVRDLVTGATRLASLTVGGNQIFGGVALGTGTAISGDGRFVAFRTAANLVTADNDSNIDVYVRDTVAGTTLFGSLAGPGSEATGQFDLSADGRFLVFVSNDGRSHAQAWVRDLSTGQVTLISHRDGAPSTPGNNVTIDVDISADGRHVGFASVASDLVAGDTTSALDVFVSSVQGGPLTMVSTNADGTLERRDSQGGAVADGGLVIAFQSDLTRIVPNDTNGIRDVFVRRLG